MIVSSLILIPHSLCEEEREIPYVLEGHRWKSEKLNCLSWSPDRSLIASGSDDGAVNIQNTTIFDDFIELEALKNEVISVAFDPTGSYLAAGTELGAVRIWDARDFHVIKDLYLNSYSYQEGLLHPAHSISFSPDGYLMTVGGDNEEYGTNIYETDSWTVLGSIDYNYTIEEVSFSPDGSILAGGTPAYHGVYSIMGGSHLTLWDTNNWELIRKIVLPVEENHQSVISLDWNPDGTMIAVGLDNYTVSMVDVMDGVVERELKADQDDDLVGVNDVLSVDWSPDGEYIAASYYNDKVRIWSKDGEVKTVYEKHAPNNIYPFMVGVNDVEWSPDGDKVASCGSGGSVQVWTPLEGEVIVSSLIHTYPLTCVDIHPNKERLITGDSDSNIVLWNLSGSVQRERMETPAYGTAFAAEFSIDGKMVAAGFGESYGKKSMVVVWDSGSKEQVCKREFKNGDVRCLGWTANHLVIGRDSGGISIYDTGKWNLEKELDIDSAMGIDISTESDLMAVATGERTITIFETVNWSVKSEVGLDDLDYALGGITAVSFSPGGEKLALGTDNGFVSIYNVERESIAHSWEEHTGSVSSVAWDPKDQYILSTGEDNTVNLLNISGEDVIWTEKITEGEGTIVRWNEVGNMAVYTSSCSVTILFDGTPFTDTNNGSENVDGDGDDDGGYDLEDDEGGFSYLIVLGITSFLVVVVTVVVIVMLVIQRKKEEATFGGLDSSEEVY